MDKVENRIKNMQDAAEVLWMHWAEVIEVCHGIQWHLFIVTLNLAPFFEVFSKVKQVTKLLLWWKQKSFQACKSYKF